MSRRFAGKAKLEKTYSYYRGDATGFGSSDVRTRRFTQIEFGGVDIKVEDDATYSTRWTINRAGIYLISYQTRSLVDTVIWGISVNANGATGFTSLAAANKLSQCRGRAGSNVLADPPCGYIGRFEAGDVIRAHHNDQNATAGQVFLARVGA